MSKTNTDEIAARLRKRRWPEHSNIPAYDDIITILDERNRLRAALKDAADAMDGRLVAACNRARVALGVKVNDA